MIPMINSFMPLAIFRKHHPGSPQKVPEGSNHDLPLCADQAFSGNHNHVNAARCFFAKQTITFFQPPFATIAHYSVAQALSCRKANAMSLFGMWKKMTQQQVAEKLGVSSVTVSGWELGRRVPEPHVLPRIAQLFGTTVDNLLGYSKTAESFKTGDVVYVPMYGSVAIIEGRLAFLDFHGTYPVPAEDATVPRGVQAVLVAAPDASMETNGIGAGSMVLTHVNAKVNPGDICLAIIDNTQVTIRHCLAAKPELVMLTTADSQKEPETYAETERKRIHVVGPCVGIFRQLPRGSETQE